MIESESLMKPENKKMERKYKSGSSLVGFWLGIVVFYCVDLQQESKHLK